MPLWILIFQANPFQPTGTSVSTPLFSQASSRHWPLRSMMSCIWRLRCGWTMSRPIRPNKANSSSMPPKTEQTLPIITRGQRIPATQTTRPLPPSANSRRYSHCVSNPSMPSLIPIMTDSPMPRKPFTTPILSTRIPMEMACPTLGKLSGALTRSIQRTPLPILMVTPYRI